MIRKTTSPVGTRYLRELWIVTTSIWSRRWPHITLARIAWSSIGGYPLFRETRAYVAKIVHEYNKKKTTQELVEKRKLAATKAATGNVKAPQKPARVQRIILSKAVSSKSCVFEIGVYEAGICGGDCGEAIEPQIFIASSKNQIPQSPPQMPAS